MEETSSFKKHYLEKVALFHSELGIPSDYADRKLPFHFAAEVLEVGDNDPEGKPMFMSPETAASWRLMKNAALADGITLLLESAFRDLEIQANIIRSQLAQSDLSSALTWIAAPGYSEHHTGRALDIGSPECFPIPVSEEFEKTKAFSWLSTNAHAYGFFMSYPRDNPYGIIFEPWHWCFHK